MAADAKDYCMADNNQENFVVLEHTDFDMVQRQTKKKEDKDKVHKDNNLLGASYKEARLPLQELDWNWRWVYFDRAH